MAIYDILEAVEEAQAPPVQEPPSQEVLSDKPRDRFFSSLAARLFFGLLLVADLLWACYASLLWTGALLFDCATLFKKEQYRKLRARAWLSLRRALVCGISLFIALFSPAFGIMVACTYFLMYDKSGVEEVVPASLQSQFKEFFVKN
ncbi:MAG: hypothetical protein JSS61_01535 [Verrucomicrobia bacterium]|nr:hypothetical protein [Verrucomicrobiota bacterium]